MALADGLAPVDDQGVTDGEAAAMTDGDFVDAQIAQIEAAVDG
ncbi:MAG: hypothetical protein QOE71_2642 [Pseudonocardiales bacterium]|jgi:hypothetical protein|nr:hypothetical protein [Pseudonocardiales bacterium]